MSSIKRIIQFSACIFITVAFLGCATAPTPQPKRAYYPKLPPGVTTLEAAIEDLATLLKTPLIYIEYGETDYKVHAGRRGQALKKDASPSYESVIIDDESASRSASRLQGSKTFPSTLYSMKAYQSTSSWIVRQIAQPSQIEFLAL
jgi:hypothetical protein